MQCIAWRLGYRRPETDRDRADGILSARPDQGRPHHQWLLHSQFMADCCTVWTLTKDGHTAGLITHKCIQPGRGLGRGDAPVTTCTENMSYMTSSNSNRQLPCRTTQLVPDLTTTMNYAHPRSTESVINIHQSYLTTLSFHCCQVSFFFSFDFSWSHLFIHCTKFASLKSVLCTMQFNSQIKNSLWNYGAVTNTPHRTRRPVAVEAPQTVLIVAVAFSSRQYWTTTGAPQSALGRPSINEM